MSRRDQLEQAFAEGTQVLADLEACRVMVQMLEDGEWAEHCAKGPISDRLEVQITKLINEAHAAADKVPMQPRTCDAVLSAALAKADDPELTDQQVLDNAAFIKSKVFPHDLFTHRNAWRQAFERLIELEPAVPFGEEDMLGYWKHELAAMDHMYRELAGLVRSGINQMDPDDGARLDLLEQLAFASYTGMSIEHNKSRAYPSVRIMWMHHLGEQVPGTKGQSAIRTAIDRSQADITQFIERKRR